MKHTSTGIAPRPTQAIDRLSGRDGTNIWEIVTSQMLYRMIAQAVHVLQNASDNPMTLEASSFVVTSNNQVDSTFAERIEENMFDQAPSAATSDHKAVRKYSKPKNNAPLSYVHSIPIPQQTPPSKAQHQKQSRVLTKVVTSSQKLLQILCSFQISTCCSWYSIG